MVKATASAPSEASLPITVHSQGGYVLSELEDLARRLEQQIESYEKLHADEMKRFEEQLQAFQRIQADELKMLRDELDQIKREIAASKEEQAERAPTSAPSQAEMSRLEPTITRRDLLTGNIPVFNPRRS